MAQRRKILRFIPLLPLAVALAACFPSAFDLTAVPVELRDERFEVIRQETLNEQGEANVAGRDITYDVDSHLAVWSSREGATIAAFSTPQVRSMTFEANPVADMSPRELLDYVLDAAPDDVRAEMVVPPGASFVVDEEEFLRLPTSLGDMDGSRFLLHVEEDTREPRKAVALIVSAKHDPDIVVVGAFYWLEDEGVLLPQIEEAVQTLEHPQPEETEVGPAAASPTADASPGLATIFN